MFRKRFIIVLLIDFGLMLGALAATLYGKYGVVSAPLWSRHFRYFLPVYLFTVFLFYLYNLYTREAFRSRSRLVISICSALAISFVAAVLYLYFQPQLNITPRRFLLLNYALIVAAIVIWRLLLGAVVRYSGISSNLLFIGEASAFENFKNEMHSAPRVSIRDILLHQGGSLKDAVQRNQISQIVVADVEADQSLTDQLFAIVPLGLRVQSYLEFYEEYFARIPAKSLNHTWFINTFRYRQKPFYDFIKRTADIIFGVVGILLNLVLFVFIAAAIKLESPGPVFFRGVRVGKNGKQFGIIKYRTMTVWDGADWAQANDVRITKVGKFLRKTRVDELPQFWNILVGHMSLVGPRPEQPQIVKQLQREIPFYEQRHLLKSGLTGWAQINSGYASSVDQSRTKFEYDLYYIKNRSLAFDLEIIAHTIRTILGFKGR